MIIESRYLSRFNKLLDNPISGFKLLGNRILVEKIEYDDVQTKSGLYLPKQLISGMSPGYVADNPQLYVVLYLGEGYFDVDTNSFNQSKMERKVGEIVIISKSLVEVFGKFCPFIDDYVSDSIGITTEDNCKFAFSSIEDFNQLRNTLMINEEV